MDKVKGSSHTKLPVLFEVVAVVEALQVQVSKPYVRIPPVMTLIPVGLSFLLESVTGTARILMMRIVLVH